MKTAACLFLGMLVAGCGGAEDKQNVATGATGPGPAPVATAPIVDQGEPANETVPAPPIRPAAPSPARDETPVLPPTKLPAYRAIGTEPFWAITLRRSVVTLERPDKPPRHIPVSRTDDAVAIRYLGQGFTMTVTQGPCSDGMSDAVWSDRVQIAFDEGTLKGCGGDRDDMRNDTR
jgi:uncharacterized membrane protein